MSAHRPAELCAGAQAPHVADASHASSDTALEADALSDLTVRKLTVDLAAGFGRYWHSGDAFRTMYYNALSMSFPVGEQSFIDSVRDALPLLPDDPRHDRLRADIAQFIGQEATHRHLHEQYNAQLARQGLVNRWERWAEPKMRLLWRWHAAEETEHKAVAFDLYRALGGSERRRVLLYVYVLLMFSAESLAQTALNLHRDGSLFKPGTWFSALTFYFGRDGVAWRCALPMLRYLAPRFHPEQHGDRNLAARWLAEHADAWRAIR
ncbi:metal-dependent hydrolase [Pandoraea terrae]|nr:metal-dependent hydrolase [Pandoraea terrae]